MTTTNHRFANNYAHYLVELPTTKHTNYTKSTGSIISNVISIEKQMAVINVIIVA